MLSVPSTSAVRLLSKRAAAKQAVRDSSSSIRSISSWRQPRSDEHSCASCSALQAPSEQAEWRVLAASLAGRQYLIALPSLSILFRSLFPSASSDAGVQSPALAIAGADSLSPAQAEAAEAEGSSGIWNWNGLLWAVPKKKVSHSRKAMRSANKGLKDRVGESSASRNYEESITSATSSSSHFAFLLARRDKDFAHCPACGKPKLAHHICAHCYSEINRWQKQEHSPLGKRA